MRALFRFFLPKWCQQKADDLVHDGVVQAENGDLSQAVALYQDALKWCPDHVLARSNMGLSLMDEYNANFGSWDSKRRLAHLHLTMDNLDEAIGLGADRVAVWRAAGHIRWRLSQFAGAVEAFERALELLDGDDEQAQSKEELENNIEELQPLVQRSQNIHDVRKVVDDKEASVDACQGAIDALDELVPEDADEQGFFCWMRGVLCRRLGEMDAAEKAFLEALESQNSHFDAHRELAQIYMLKEAHDEALLHSVAAYKLKPRDAGLVCNVGVCYLALDDFDKAKEYMELAHGMDPENGIINSAREALAAASEG